MDRVALVFVALLAPGPVLAQQPSEPEGTRLAFTAALDPSLRRALVALMDKESAELVSDPDEKARLEAARADVNLDGQPEVFLRLVHEDVCSDGNCPFWGFALLGPRPITVIAAKDVAEVTVCDAFTGWGRVCDLVTTRRRGDRPPLRIRWTFDGKAYEPPPELRAKPEER